MAESTVQQVILEAVRGVGGGGDLASELAEATRRIDVLASVEQALAEVVAGNTEAVTGNTAAQGAKGIATEAGKAASGILTSAFGLIPLVSGLARLFGGGETTAPAPLVKYTPPAPISLEGRLQTAGVPPDSTSQTEARVAEAARRDTALPPAQQITVQVHAMDSRSFLDHSHEIARAVREAMLEMNSINDVVSDL